MTDKKHENINCQCLKHKGKPTKASVYIESHDAWCCADCFVMVSRHLEEPLIKMMENAHD